MLAFLMTLIAGLSTLIGYFAIYIKASKNNLIKISLSFAAGVMLCVSISDLIPESLSLLMVDNSKNKAFILAFLIIIIGIVITQTIDKIIPENNNKLYKLGIFAMLAIILHNVPEGIATFLSASTNLTLGIAITLAIALHNIPEGITISVPIYESTGSKKKAFIYTLISGMAEPLGAILAFLFLKPVVTDNLMGIILALTAGIMLYISVNKLLVEAFKYKEKSASVIAFIIGLVFMLISHILLQ